MSGRTTDARLRALEQRLGTGSADGGGCFKCRRAGGVHILVDGQPTDPLFGADDAGVFCRACGYRRPDGLVMVLTRDVYEAI